MTHSPHVCDGRLQTLYERFVAGMPLAQDAQVACLEGIADVVLIHSHLFPQLGLDQVCGIHCDGCHLHRASAMIPHAHVSAAACFIDTHSRGRLYCCRQL